MLPVFSDCISCAAFSVSEKIQAYSGKQLELVVPFRQYQVKYILQEINISIFK